LEGDNKISAVIIAGNEEKNIERCLNSLLNVADEIVVVDSFSTDNTVKLAESLGAKVVQREFEGYVEQKRYAITCAENSWILSLDADEALSEELIKSILKIKNELKKDTVFAVNRLNNFCGQWIRHCGWYPDVKLRLFHKNSGDWAGSNPHDKFIVNHGVQMGHLPGDLLHYTFYTLEEHNKQIDRFSGIAAQAYYDKGIRANSLNLIFSPLFKFLRNYVIKLGFLDGYYGWLICIRSARATYLKYDKLKMIQVSLQGQQSSKSKVV
jgi:glycosyltransferase involved in cell wall biosynthesis